MEQSTETREQSLRHILVAVNDSRQFENRFGSMVVTFPTFFNHYTHFIRRKETMESSLENCIPLSCSSSYSEHLVFVAKAAQSQLLFGNDPFYNGLGKDS